MIIGYTIEELVLYILIAILIAFVCFVITWILTKMINLVAKINNKLLVPNFFFKFDIVVLIIYVLYYSISFIFNTNNGSASGWTMMYSIGEGSVPFRESDELYFFLIGMLGLIIAIYIIFQGNYVTKLKNYRSKN
jgi:hypothetical protein